MRKTKATANEPTIIERHNALFGQIEAAKTADDVRVLVEVNDEKEIRDYKVEDLRFRPRKKKMKLSEEEFRELKALEDKGGQSSFDKE